MSTQEPYDDYADPKGWWLRMKERVFGVEEPEEEDPEQLVTPDARRRAALRVESVRSARVAVRLNAMVFNDARTAADGLKNGQQQIVNLEKAPPDTAERIIDFLSGVTYALDGSVERIGEKVFLFAPVNVQVEMDGGELR